MDLAIFFRPGHEKRIEAAVQRAIKDANGNAKNASPRNAIAAAATTAIAHEIVDALMRELKSRDETILDMECRLAAIERTGGSKS